jgi:hypothetical protein
VLKVEKEVIVVFQRCKKVLVLAGANLSYVFWETGFKNKDFCAIPLFLLELLTACHDLVKAVFQDYNPPG